MLSLRKRLIMEFLIKGNPKINTEDFLTKSKPVASAVICPLLYKLVTAEFAKTLTNIKCASLPLVACVIASRKRV